MDILSLFSKDKIWIEACPQCGGRRFYVTRGELVEAEGCIECDNCGRFLFPEPEKVWNFQVWLNGHPFEILDVWTENGEDATRIFESVFNCQYALWYEMV